MEPISSLELKGMRELMLDIIEIENQYYVRAQSAFADHQKRVLMSGDLFGVFDRRGDFRRLVSIEQGLFYKEMRHLSSLVLRLKEGALRLLSSSIQLDNAVLAVDLTNGEMLVPGSKVLPHGTLHCYRSNFLWRNSCYQRLEISNYALEPIAVDLILEFEADFADIFEVRGVPRKRRGQLLEPHVGESSVNLGYLGLDGLRRETRVELSRPPSAITGQQMQVPIRLAPGEQTNLTIHIQCKTGEEEIGFATQREAAAQLAVRGAEIAKVEIDSSNQQFNDWVQRSLADLRMLVATSAEGMYPYAGVPWYSTVFGRDGLITALEYLWACPKVAQGVLSHLAATQATEVDQSKDAEPGKILHEARQSEMACVGEVPFRRYYGSVDSTPLFVLLAAAYFKRTSDRELIAAIWPNIEKALDWIDYYGDRDGDGFVEYGRSTPEGLLQQGWKDSQESIFHADRSIAKGPIALCEVQSYVYAAKRGIADVSRALGGFERARELCQEAESLKNRFHEAFWCEEISTYAVALDGSKQRCQVRSSNAGHTLFSGIASEGHVDRIITELGSENYFSGWGIRTIAAGEARYNPMSYHNGSVWPHDNALISYGLSRAQNKALAGDLLAGLLDASIFLESHRLPELFCGFPKRDGMGPTLYPVACAPQAWAAGAVFLLFQACLGMEILAADRAVRFVHPMLPESMTYVRIRGLQVGSATIDLELTRDHETVGIAVSRRIGEVQIITVK
jgi:glycogen debranching enzyme